MAERRRTAESGAYCFWSTEAICMDLRQGLRWECWNCLELERGSEVVCNITWSCGVVASFLYSQVHHTANFNCIRLYNLSNKCVCVCV
jgi:hypothetical protein